jgi:hypothetical protein
MRKRINREKGREKGDKVEKGRERREEEKKEKE